jgi:hypothetical protein
MGQSKLYIQQSKTVLVHAAQDYQAAMLCHCSRKNLRRREALSASGVRWCSPEMLVSFGSEPWGARKVQGTGEINDPLAHNVRRKGL